MHRKPIFVLAGVFLVIALIVPPVLYILQADNDLDNLIILQNPNGIQTNGNVTIPQETTENHANTNLIVIVVEVVFALLFVVTMYFGIKHTHPEH